MAESARKECDTNMINWIWFGIYSTAVCSFEQTVLCFLQ